MILSPLFPPLLLLTPTTSIYLSDSQVSLIKQRLADGANASWEFGTRTLALISLDVPLYSPFNPDQSLPPPSNFSPSSAPSLATVFSIANTTVAERPTQPRPPPLFPDGSAADPASMGTAVLLANWTGQGGEDYAKAAKDQLNFLFSANVPKTTDGAFSHRMDEVQLWSDFVYMVPPFLAYYGALNGNKSLLLEAYNQIKLYRDYLRDPDTGMWRHIVLGLKWPDPGFWATGNGWASLGMLRVLAIIQRSQYANKMKHQQEDLADWVGEIHDGVYGHLNFTTSLFTNYVNQPSTFPDASSTAILAASVYRISTLWGDHRHIGDAERCRGVLVGSGEHLTGDGWVTPVVNPNSYGRQGSKSPEAQAFMLEMEAAYRDWVRDGSKGGGAGSGGSGGGGGGRGDGGSGGSRGGGAFSVRISMGMGRGSWVLGGTVGLGIWMGMGGAI